MTELKTPAPAEALGPEQGWGSGFDAGMSRAESIVYAAVTRGETPGTPPLGLLDVLDEIARLRARAEAAERDIAGAQTLIDERTKIVRHLPGEPETIKWRVDALTNLAEKYRGSLSTMIEEARKWRDRAQAAEAQLADALKAIDAAIQCETDLLDVYQRHTSLTTLDHAVADLKRDSLPKLKAARTALAGDQAGTHVISAERSPAGITPGMVEAAQRIARSVVRSESFSLELGEGVTLPAGRLRLTALKDGAGAFEFLPDAPEQP